MDNKTEYKKMVLHDLLNIREYYFRKHSYHDRINNSYYNSIISKIDKLVTELYAENLQVLRQ